MLVIGRNHVPSNPTNRRQDAEYLLYLPFCHVFVSDDGVHKALAPMLLAPYQEFLTREQFLARVEHAKKPPAWLATLCPSPGTARALSDDERTAVERVLKVRYASA